MQKIQEFHLLKQNKEGNDLLEVISDDLFFFFNKAFSLCSCILQALFIGYNFRREPFLNQLTVSTELSHLIMLKNKSKMLLADSATLMGIVDPFNILQEDEIFVQIRRDVSCYDSYK